MKNNGSGSDATEAVTWRSSPGAITGNTAGTDIPTDRLTVINHAIVEDSSIQQEAQSGKSPVQIITAVDVAVVRRERAATIW
jgi:hypothetical protein